MASEGNPYHYTAPSTEADGRCVFEGTITASDARRAIGQHGSGRLMVVLGSGFGLLACVFLLLSMPVKFFLYLLTPGLILGCAGLYNLRWVRRAIQSGACYVGPVEGFLSESLIELKFGDAILRFVPGLHLVEAKAGYVSIHDGGTVFQLPGRIFSDFRAAKKLAAPVPRTTDAQVEVESHSADVLFSGEVTAGEVAIVPDWKLPRRYPLVGIVSVLAIVVIVMVSSQGNAISNLYFLAIPVVFIAVIFILLARYAGKKSDLVVKGGIHPSGICVWSAAEYRSYGWHSLSGGGRAGDLLWLRPRATPGLFVTIHRRQFETAEDWVRVTQLIEATLS